MDFQSQTNKDDLRWEFLRERKHALDQEKSKIQEKKKEKTLPIKKKANFKILILFLYKFPPQAIFYCNPVVALLRAGQ